MLGKYPRLPGLRLSGFAKREWIIYGVCVRTDNFK